MSETRPLHCSIRRVRAGRVFHGVFGMILGRDPLRLTAVGAGTAPPRDPGRDLGKEGKANMPNHPIPNANPYLGIPIKYYET